MLTTLAAVLLAACMAALTLIVTGVIDTDGGTFVGLCASTAALALALTVRIVSAGRR
ncbi:hypothetical protein [Frankia sp. R43]|uniref:hypothetical protein n=1 Tax=Frankia sp. R43 TaxID=269536 RepID=UPI000A993905|nr:hypothetical protein [Frankia sp. R43]